LMMLYIPDWLPWLVLEAIGLIMVIIGGHLFMSNCVIDYAHKIRNGLILVIIGMIVLMVGTFSLLLQV